MFFVSQAQAQVPEINVNVAFSTYSDGNLMAGPWLSRSGNWQIKSGKLLVIGDDRGLLLCNGCAEANEQIAITSLSVGMSPSNKRREAGIALLADDDDYWRLSLVQSPGSKSTRSVELDERKNGVWNAATIGPSKLLQIHTSQFAWQPNVTYRLVLIMDADIVSGFVLNGAGAELGSIAYRLDHDAVRSGTPALTEDGLQASFSDFERRVQRQSGEMPPSATALILKEDFEKPDAVARWYFDKSEVIQPLSLTLDRSLAHSGDGALKIVVQATGIKSQFTCIGTSTIGGEIGRRIRVIFYMRTAGLAANEVTSSVLERNADSVTGWANGTTSLVSISPCDQWKQVQFECDLADSTESVSLYLTFQHPKARQTVWIDDLSIQQLHGWSVGVLNSK